MANSAGKTLKFCLNSKLLKEHQAYEEAVNALNRLQSNASILRKATQKGEKILTQSLNVQLTNKYLNRCGIDLNEFERRIGVVHVSGTKGKGTTCALCESCLRAHGYRTGLFTSPHLMNVLERIRINGNPLSADEFVKHFWTVYRTLENNKDDEGDMPSYFKFLTVMAFSVFLKEKVDFAVFEVGIGGELDCTNVLRKTPVVGITSLDLDHIQLLGDNIESIAWQKAGIMKPGSYAFTVQENEKSALDVLFKRSREKGAKLFVVPPLDQYGIDTSMMSPVIKLNASLAVQLTRSIINWKNGLDSPAPFTEMLDQESYNGLLNCWWPGRCQIVPKESVTYYLDGAHTSNSAIVSSQWFDSTAPRLGKRALIFNCTGTRDPLKILQHLIKCDFDVAVFTTNNINSKANPADMLVVGLTKNDVMEKCQLNKNVWQKLLQKKEYKNNNCKIITTESVTKAVELFQQNVFEPYGWHILVTGSLHLVGSTLAVLGES